MMHAPVAPASFPSTDTPSSGGRLVSSTGRALPLLGASLSADAAGGVARVTLEQTFHNPHAEPLAVTYTLPLPADGAVSGFSFRVGARRVVGEIDRKQAARERYEEALMEGKSAALLEQDRSSLFTQEIGNIPPGEDVVVEVSVDQRLRWLAEGCWEWRFPTVAAPRYLGEPGRVADAARVAVDVATATPVRFSLSCVVRDALEGSRRLESPSHALDIRPAGGGLRVELRDRAGAPLDRDLVLRWAVATPRVGVSLAMGEPRLGSAYGLCTLVPPSVEGACRAVPRDVIILLDTSGSMAGGPLAQAVRVASAIVESLREEDQLELLEFSSVARRWRVGPTAASGWARKSALEWLKALKASGSTEMRHAIEEALHVMRPGAQRQVVLVTDGLIGFESQVVQVICDRLPVSSRLHTVGVGSAVNRSLTGPAARAGHGLEVVLGLGEDPERAAARLVARTTDPLLVDLQLEGSALLGHAPARLPDLFAGSPALVGVMLRPEGGDLVVRGRTLEGSWEQHVRVPASVEGSGSASVTALFGREKVEDLELRLGAGGDARELNGEIERLGVDFQISTRLTSWVAVSQEQTVDPGDPLRRQRVPQALPYGMSAEGMGLRPASGSMPRSSALAGPPMQASSELRGGGGSFWTAIGASAGGRAERSDAADDGRPGMRSGGFQATNGPLSAPRRATYKPDVADDGRKKKWVDPRPGSPSRAGAASGKKIADPESPAPPPPPAPKRTVIGTLRDLILGKPEETSADDVVQRAVVPPQAPGAAAAALRRLSGRIAIHRGVALVLEVLVEGDALAWEPGATLSIVLADGRTVEATVETARSTRPGPLELGQIARLALTLRAPVAPGTLLRIVLVPGRLEIVLGPG